MREEGEVLATPVLADGVQYSQQFEKCSLPNSFVLVLNTLLIIFLWVVLIGSAQLYVTPHCCELS